MFSKSKISVFLFFSILFASAGLQAQTFPFYNLTPGNGLSQAQVLSVFQNDNRVIWFGTNGGGITLFDGHSFEYFTDKSGLPDNVIYSITKGPGKDIYIGTSNGFSVYNGQSFTNYDTASGLASNWVFNVFVDSKQQVWLGTSSGVSLFKDGKLTKHKIDAGLDESKVFNISEDSKHQLLFSTLGDGLFIYDGKKCISYTNGMASDVVYSSFEASDDTYWLFNHLGWYELKNGKINQLGKDLFKDQVTYYSALKDFRGGYWIACSKGVIRSVNGHVQLLNHTNGLVDDNIWKLLQDKEGNIWMASKENGVSRIYSERFKNYTSEHGLPSDAVNAIAQTPDADVWVGTKKGLYNLTQKKNYNSNQGLPSNIVNGIASDSKGNLWIATDKGICFKSAKGFKTFLAKEGVQDPLSWCYNVNISSIGDVFISTKAGVGIVVNEQIVPLFEQLKEEVFYAYKQDNSDLMYVSTYSGVYKCNVKLKSIEKINATNGFTNKRVHVITADQKSNLWFSTEDGLYCYDGKSFKSYGLKDRFASQNIYSIVFTSAHEAVLATASGIEKIEIDDNGTITKNQNYSIEDGLIANECNTDALRLTSDNKLLIGTVAGLSIYDPQFDREQELEPITYIKSIDLFSQKTQWKLYADSVSDQNIPMDLELDHFRNYLTFRFTAVSHTSPAKVKYRYMLKGLDKDWISTNKNEVGYSNLDPGKYEFILEAENGAGVWNKEPVIFSFRILPPFWQTWWFYSLVTLIILGGIYSYFTIKASNKKILKQNEIIERTNDDLELANSEIALKNKNITDSINYAKRIQEAILPPQKLIKKNLPESFILYKPKDIISGDFYWFNPITNGAMIAAVDCTGHGVPGALVSMVGHNGLTRAVKEFGLSNPGEVMDKLSALVEETLRQNDSAEVKDGMDMALCTINTTDKTIQYAGANNPMYLVRKKEAIAPTGYVAMIEEGDHILYEFKADKQPVGVFEFRKRFTTHTIPYVSGDSIYLLSDGYADQFGGPKGKKFLYKPLKKKLLEMQSLSMDKQCVELDSQFERWKGGLEQVDDVLVIGVKLS